MDLPRNSSPPRLQIYSKIINPYFNFYQLDLLFLIVQNIIIDTAHNPSIVFFLWNVLDSFPLPFQVHFQLFPTLLSALKVKVLVIQSCPTLYNLVDCSPSGSAVHGIFQARILEWDAIFFSRGSSWPRDHRIWVSCIAGRFFTLWATREAQTDLCLLSLSSHVINKDNNQHLFEFANYINILFLPKNFSSNIVLPTVFFLILSEVESELGDL